MPTTFLRGHHERSDEPGLHFLNAGICWKRGSVITHAYFLTSVMHWLNKSTKRDKVTSRFSFFSLQSPLNFEAHLVLLFSDRRYLQSRVLMEWQQLNQTEATFFGHRGRQVHGTQLLVSFDASHSFCPTSTKNGPKVMRTTSAEVVEFPQLAAIFVLESAIFVLILGYAVTSQINLPPLSKHRRLLMCKCSSRSSVHFGPKFGFPCVESFIEAVQHAALKNRKKNFMSTKVQIFTLASDAI